MARTIRTKIYKFNEFSKAAQEKAIDWWLSDPYAFQYVYDEASESLDAFCKIFDIDKNVFDYDEPHRNKYSFGLSDTILDLFGQRLATYIWNNYKGSLYKGKYFGKLVGTFKDGSPIPISKDHPAGLRHVLRYSKCLLEESCPLTGTCYDQDILQPMYDFMRKPDNRNFKDILEDCFYSLSDSVRDEIRGASKPAFVAETILTNEYEFLKDGTKY